MDMEFRLLTGMGFYDDIINYPDYMRENKGVCGVIEYMSPEEYLSICYEYQGDTFVVDKEAYDKLLEAVKNGAEIDMPVLDFRDGYFFQEGRHRAVLAKDLGVDKIPVLVVNNCEDM